jgi:hypothetical protein
MGSEPALAASFFLCRARLPPLLGCHDIPVDIYVHRSWSDVFESPSSISCIQANRTEGCLLFNCLFASTRPATPCHGHAVLPALGLLLCMLFSSVRGISECFRALYHLDAAHAFVHHTVIAASLGCDVFAIGLVHVGSPRISLTAFQCHPMQVDANVAATQGRDQACQSAVTSLFHSAFPGFRERPRRSRGTRMSSRDESDPALFSLH